jgi:hypothetical protein
LSWADTRRVRGAIATRCAQGAMHQSRLEARRCTELTLMERGGLIRDLKAHPQERYRLDVNGVHVCDYMADFVYFDIERNCEVVEDTKGWQTDISKFKLRLMLGVHGISVELVRRAGKSRWR